LQWSRSTFLAGVLLSDRVTRHGCVPGSIFWLLSNFCPDLSKLPWPIPPHHELHSFMFFFLFQCMRRIPTQRMRRI
jgi:hypothetical protein